jgi:hypothetical protein
MSEERPVEPFSDLHVEEGHVRATLLHDPTVEGLDVGLYLDGSGSMKEEYAYNTEHPKRTFWQWLLGEPRPQSVVHPNEVEPQARWMLQYLATKDRNGLLRVAYWATGGNGKQVQVVGEMPGTEVHQYAFPGPKEQGGYTYLKPAIDDYIAYLRSQVPNGARRGLAVFITDGALHDADQVIALTGELARMIKRGQLPRLNFVLVGVGDGVDEEQLDSCRASTSCSSVSAMASTKSNSSASVTRSSKVSVTSGVTASRRRSRTSPSSSRFSSTRR